MRIGGSIRARWPGRIAAFAHFLVIIVLGALIFAGSDTLRAVASGVAQLAGVRTDSGGSAGVTVDSDGRITYRSKRVAADDLVAVLKRGLESSASSQLAIRADGKADATIIAQIMNAAERAGAAQVRLSIVQNGK